MFDSAMTVYSPESHYLSRLVSAVPVVRSSKANYKELIGLNLSDLQLQPCATILVRGKGRKERCLPLWKETASALCVRGASL